MWTPALGRMEENKMENLCDAAITIFEAVENIDNEKYVMPAFQR